MDSSYRIVSQCLWQVLSDGSVKCWGANHRGQLGHGNLEDAGDQPGEMGTNLPVTDLGDGMTVVHITAGSHYNCAILQDATLKCWGSGVSGQPGPQLGELLLKESLSKEIQSSPRDLEAWCGQHRELGRRAFRDGFQSSRGRPRQSPGAGCKCRLRPHLRAFGGRQHEAPAIGKETCNCPKP